MRAGQRVDATARRSPSSPNTEPVDGWRSRAVRQAVGDAAHGRRGEAGAAARTVGGDHVHRGAEPRHRLLAVGLLFNCHGPLRVSGCVDRDYGALRGGGRGGVRLPAPCDHPVVIPAFAGMTTGVATGSGSGTGGRRWRRDVLQRPPLHRRREERRHDRPPTIDRAHPIAPQDRTSLADPDQHAEQPGPATPPTPAERVEQPIAIARVSSRKLWPPVGSGEVRRGEATKKIAVIPSVYYIASAHQREQPAGRAPSGYR